MFPSERGAQFPYESDTMKFLSNIIYGKSGLRRNTGRGRSHSRAVRHLTRAHIARDLATAISEKSHGICAGEENPVKGFKRGDHAVNMGRIGGTKKTYRGQQQ